MLSRALFATTAPFICQSGFIKERVFYSIFGALLQFLILLFWSNLMCATQIILTVDPNLGRVDLHSFSDQTLMEMLIEGFTEETKQRYKDERGVYLDVCEWESVRCDEAASVVEIQEYNGLRGSLQLAYTPAKVRKIHTSDTELSGSIQLTNLPESIRELKLIRNAFSGALELTQMPRGMVGLTLNRNQFTGSVDLTKLPECMRDLSLAQNTLTGSVDLTKLPGGIEDVSLYNNQFTGSIDLTHLPQHMKYLGLHENQFAGSIDLTNLPQSMSHLYLLNNAFTGSFVAVNIPLKLRRLSASGNHFDAIAVVDSETNAQILLIDSGVKSVIDENSNAQVEGVEF